MCVSTLLVEQKCGVVVRGLPLFALDGEDNGVEYATKKLF